MKSLALCLLLLVLSAMPAQAGSRKILIIGASISWGCVGDCDEVQTEDGYVKRLRTLLPEDDIRVIAWFGAGVADWDPLSPSTYAQQLDFPVGVWEEGQGTTANLWQLLAAPQLKQWQPDYVVVMAGLGDALRVFRPPIFTLEPTSGALYEEALDRITREILRAGATPVLTVDCPFTADLTLFDPFLVEYEQAIENVCSTWALRCGPDLPENMDRVTHYTNTDGVHPNAAGHQAVAEAFEAWFLGEPEPLLCE